VTRERNQVGKTPAHARSLQGLGIAFWASGIVVGCAWPTAAAAASTEARMVPLRRSDAERGRGAGAEAKILHDELPEDLAQPETTFRTQPCAEGQGVHAAYAFAFATAAASGCCCGDEKPGEEARAAERGWGGVVTASVFAGKGAMRKEADEGRGSGCAKGGERAGGC